MAATRLGTYSQTKGSPTKIPCRVASTGNIASLSTLLTVDTVTVSAGDRVLVWQQSTPSQNNIYLASTGAWTVAPDMSLAADIFIGMKVFVYAGTTYLKKTFALTAVSPVTFEVESTSGVSSSFVVAMAVAL
jgi:phage-related tail fiber protein